MKGAAVPSQPVKVTAALSLLLLAVFNLTAAAAQSTLTVPRDESTLVISNYGEAVNGARTLLQLAACEPGILSSYFYGPPDEVELLIDDETRLRSSVAIIRRAADAAEGEGQETLELVDGEAVFADRPPCLEEVVRAQEQRVLLEQGRTTVHGTRFFLDRESDTAQMDGPVELQRRAEGDGEELQARARELVYDLGANRSTLTGEVRVTSGERVTEAETLELDEEAGLATLTGSPAVSREGEDEIRGETLLYYLDSNDVIIIGGVQGTLEVDLE